VNKTKNQQKKDLMSLSLNFFEWQSKMPSKMPTPKQQKIN